MVQLYHKGGEWFSVDDKSLQSHFCLLSCKYSLMLFNFSLVLSSSAEILSSGLTLHIHLTFLVSVLCTLITSPSLTGQVSRPYRITLRTHAKYNLPFAHKVKPLLLNKDTKFLRNLSTPDNKTPFKFKGMTI